MLEMKYILFLIVPLLAFAQTTTTLEYVPREAVTWSKEEVIELIGEYAAKYGIDSGDMYAIVKCETAGTFDPTIQSQHILRGVQEPSFGLAQIHLPSHPTVSKEEAKDPHFALNFLARNMKDGRVGMWSCARILGIR
jgi:hypothetical protein